MKISTNVHTIFLLVGSSECGKSTFAKNILIPSLSYRDDSRNYKTNIQYLSSDDIRREILGEDFDKHSTIMLEASEQAFELLFTKLKMVTTFPINAEFVIVDTTGLSESFRDQVVEIANENSYNVDLVLFDYKNIREYYSSDRSKKLIDNHVRRLRTEVIPNIKRNNYRNIHRIREKNFLNPTNFEIKVDNMEDYIFRKLPTKYKYTIVGDVHEQVLTFQKLLSKAGFTVQNNQIIESEKSSNHRILLVGDWIDKGSKVKEIIEFIYSNRTWFYFIKGNHENFVSKYLLGQLKDSSIDQSLVETYFTSIKTLEKDEELQGKFLELVNESKEFYHYIGEDFPSYYITHAPCKKKYIGKMDNNSSRHQRSFRIDRNQPIQEQLQFLAEEAVSNHPYHVFGHVASKKLIRIKNKFGIDTGAASGNQLTSIRIYSNNPYLYSVPSVGEDVVNKEELPELFKGREKSINLYELDQRDKRRLNYVLKNSINYISGTMSPADKDTNANDLESLKQGLQYFKDKKVQEVVLQPKYMGSRCNIYLSKSIEDCYAVSRNGYRVKNVDLSGVYTKLLERFTSFMEKENIKTLILDGELLPWSVLGTGLIEGKFNVLSKSLRSELSILKETGFDEHLNKLISRYEQTDFHNEVNHTTKQVLTNKYGHNDYSTFSAVKETLKSYVPIKKHEELLDIYDEQLIIYGAESEIEYKPFNLLKMVYENGEEKLPSLTTAEIFSLVSDDDYLVLSLDDEYYFENANRYYETLTTTRKMEGVVIKPNHKTFNSAPFLKVRNADYLTLVYGYDYKLEHKYQKLIKQKRINKKINASIKDYILGQKMLEYPLSSISNDNEQYKQLIANKLFEEQQAKEIDPRL